MRIVQLSLPKSRSLLQRYLRSRALTPANKCLHQHLCKMGSFKLLLPNNQALCKLLERYAHMPTPSTSSCQLLAFRRRAPVLCSAFILPTAFYVIKMGLAYVIDYLDLFLLDLFFRFLHHSSASPNNLLWVHFTIVRHFYTLQ